MGQGKIRHHMKVPVLQLLVHILSPPSELLTSLIPRVFLNNMVMTFRLMCLATFVLKYRVYQMSERCLTGFR